MSIFLNAARSWAPGRIVAVLVFATLLSACGQKGPLYLPTEPAATTQSQ